ncbi:WRKY transcription factor 21-like [Tripterygium wilfordii]|uniref:WRKY transcription factor 21-like n=1 Tax=Tripterygium wilfordii TaxID=458696 RepID=A0A7J7D6C8_TRIWF|nr:WRKY transcription factor 21-like [Tripterygium wilfordii]
MEEVEEANRSAVESSHKVLSLLSLPQDQVQYRNLMLETGEAVFRFKKVVSLLNTGLGHARVRKLKQLPNSCPKSILLDYQQNRTDNPSKTLQLLQSSFQENPLEGLGSNAKNSLYMGNPTLELSSNGKSLLQLAQQTTSSSQYNLLQQQQQLQQRLQLHQQQLKQQAEMMFRRSNSGNIG